MNISQYLVLTLEKFGIDTAFSVTGGGSMFLNNALGNSKKIKVIYMHHEQSCAIAAEAFSRLNNKPALVCVTTGPGGINALNGVFGAYTDSIPLIVVSGQVKRETNMFFKKSKNLRQLGDQENDIISMVNKITKGSLLVKSKKNLTKNLSKLLKLSVEGRPGPVWIDIPIDIQSELL